MSRRRKDQKRELIPDPRYGDIIISKFSNSLMQHGRKAISERLLYGALEKIKEKTGQESLKVFKEAIDNVMPYSRRRSNNTYCKSTVSSFTHNDNLKNAFDVIDTLRSAREISRHVGTRYTKLNIDSFWKHGTIEFRHHAGTTDKDKISNWLKLVMTMVQAADQVRSVKVKRFDCKNTYMDKISLMLKGLGQVENSLVDAQVKRFFTKRRRELCS